MVEKDGKINSQTGLNFFQALWNRTGGGTGIPNQINSGVLTAEGTTQSDALSLMADWNIVSVTPANSGVIIPALVGGQVPILVWNYGANSLNVYPPVGSAIDSLAVDAPYVLVTLKMQIFYFFAPESIFSQQLG